MVNPESYTVGYGTTIKEPLISKNSGSHITEIMVIRKKSFLDNQMSFMSSMNIPINERIWWLIYFILDTKTSQKSIQRKVYNQSFY